MLPPPPTTHRGHTPPPGSWLLNNSQGGDSSDGQLVSASGVRRAARGTPHSGAPAHRRFLPAAFWMKLASLDYVWINDISWFRLLGFDCEICTVHSLSALPDPRVRKDKYILFPHQRRQTPQALGATAAVSHGRRCTQAKGHEQICELVLLSLEDMTVTFPGLHRPPASPGPAQRWEGSDGDMCGPGEGRSRASAESPPPSQTPETQLEGDVMRKSLPKP